MFVGHSAAGVANSDASKTRIVGTGSRGDGHGARFGVLYRIVDQVAHKDFEQQPVATHGDGRGLEDQPQGIAAEVVDARRNVVEHLLERDRRAAELQPAGNGEVGPVLNIFECAYQLASHLAFQLVGQMVVLQIGDERRDVVAQHRQTGFDIGDALNILLLCGLQACRLALQRLGAAVQQQQRHQQGYS